jgi:two-component system, cell cycle sensor histidine kinase and response regulator CckA
MSRPHRSAIPGSQENDRLRTQITGLEQQLARLRHSLAESEQRNANGPQPVNDQYYKEVFDHLSVCMFFIDVTPDGRFRYAGFNPAEERASGLSSQEVTGKFVEEIFEPELAQKLCRNYRRCLEAGKPITYDDELNLPAGRRYFHSNLIPLRNSAGEIDRIVGACIDTTDLKRTQEEAIGRQKLESLGVLAAGIAHDFNNLLGSILAEAELAETEMAVGASASQEIRAIQSLATRAGEMVRELMTYAGKDSSTRGPTDLSLLVQEMLELLKISISKHATLHVDLPPNLPPIHANPAQLRQVIMNLITNASEALGGAEGVISISISTASTQQSSAENGVNAAATDCLRLTISDTGSGMSQDVLPRIFDPFYTTKFSGRGLGLAAVQGIIRSHNGAINVTSAPGQGSRFEILLPCSSTSATDAISGLVKSHGGAFGCPAGTILMIEDEESLRQAVATMLRKRGFRVIEAGDGATGTQLFQTNHAIIDAILLDMTLPIMTGSEVFKTMLRVRPDIKVILTSAYGHDKLDVEQTPWAYIRKPYRIAELSELLGRACQQRVPL